MNAALFFLIITLIYIVYCIFVSPKNKRLIILGFLAILLAIYCGYIVYDLIVEVTGCTESAVIGYLWCSFIKMKIICYCGISATSIAIAIISFVKAKKSRKEFKKEAYNGKEK